MKWIAWIPAVLAAILAVCVAGLFAAGMRADAGRIHATIEVHAPAAETWTWVEYPNKLKRWVSWLADVRSDPAAQRGAGAKAVLVIRDENNGGRPMEVESVCTEYAPPTRLSVRLSAEGEFDEDETYRLSDLGGERSRLEIESRYRYHSPLARLMEPVITSIAQKKMIGDVVRLKRLLDGAAAAR